MFENPAINFNIILKLSSWFFEVVDNVAICHFSKRDKRVCLQILHVSRGFFQL